MAVETAASTGLAEGKWPSQGQWTYSDYKRLPQDGWRYEIIEYESGETARSEVLPDFEIAVEAMCPP